MNNKDLNAAIDYYFSEKSDKLEEGVVFFLREYLLIDHMAIEILQQELIDSEVILTDHYITVKGKHPVFIPDFYYYDCAFIQTPKELFVDMFIGTQRPPNL